MKNVIVTGANGFIGRNLVMALIDKGYKVIALDINFDELLLSKSNIMCINVNNKKVKDLKELLPLLNYDCFYHLAWIGTSGNDRSDYEIQLNNVKIACDYVKLCCELNCKRIIYASSINEMETYEYLQSDYINPGGGYIYGTGKLAAHFMAETVAKLNEVDFIPIIITNIYGVGEKSARMIYTSIKKLINNEHCSFTSGNQTYDFIYITDAINSIIEVSEKGSAFCRYYVGSGSPKPLKEFLIEMRNIVNPEAEIGLGEIPFTGIDISYSQFNLNKIEKDTGYKNKVSFSDGVKMTADWIRKEENQ